jgi:hypothetical protein
MDFVEITCDDLTQNTQLTLLPLVFLGLVSVSRFDTTRFDDRDTPPAPTPPSTVGKLGRFVKLEKSTQTSQLQHT